MPVLVTAADQPFARRLALRLLDEGGEVRAYSDEPVADLRAAGVVVASGAADDEGRLEAALADVHTVVHAGAAVLDGEPARLRAEIAVLVAAAAGAGVRRVIALSLPGADAGAGDPLRRAAAAMEADLSAAPPPSVVIRTSLVDSPATRDALATGGLDAAARAVEIAPVRADDLLELLVAFDRARSRAAEGHLVVSADGPDRLSVDAFLDRVAVPPPGRGGLIGRRLPDEARRERLHAVLLGGPWWSDDPAVVDGWAFADLAPAAP